jgi:hypothetical protein
VVAIDFSATMIAEAQRSCIPLWKLPHTKQSCATAKQIIGRMQAKPFAHEADELTLAPQHGERSQRSSNHGRDTPSDGRSAGCDP